MIPTYKLGYGNKEHTNVAHTNIDWVRCPSDRRPTSDYYVITGGNLIS